jgi:hypothetical protein
MQTLPGLEPLIIQPIAQCCITKIPSHNYCIWLKHYPSILMSTFWVLWHVILEVFTDVSEELTASIFRVKMSRPVKRKL